MKNKYTIAVGIICAGILVAQTGAVVFAQNTTAKNISDEMGTTSTTTVPSAESQIFGRGVDTLKNMVPESVSSTTGSVFSQLNDFRLRERNLVEIARFYNIEQIDNLNQKEIVFPSEFTWKNHAERILRYVHWMFLVLGGTILTYAWIFYFALFLVVYIFLRATWRRIRRSGIHSDT